MNPPDINTPITTNPLETTDLSSEEEVIDTTSIDSDPLSVAGSHIKDLEWKLKEFGKELDLVTSRPSSRASVTSFTVAGPSLPRIYPKIHYYLVSDPISDDEDMVTKFSGYGTGESVITYIEDIESYIVNKRIKDGKAEILAKNLTGSARNRFNREKPGDTFDTDKDKFEAIKEWLMESYHGDDVKKAL